LPTTIEFMTLQLRTPPAPASATFPTMVQFTSVQSVAAPPHPSYEFTQSGSARTAWFPTINVLYAVQSYMPPAYNPRLLRTMQLNKMQYSNAPPSPVMFSTMQFLSVASEIGEVFPQ